MYIHSGLIFLSFDINNLTELYPNSRWCFKWCYVYVGGIVLFECRFCFHLGR